MGSRANLARDIARPIAAFTNRRQAPRLLTASSLFDQAWVEHQFGRRFASRADAVAAYLGAREPDLSPHPLFQGDWFDPKRTWFEHKYADPLSLYLSRAELRRTRSPHPLFDTGVYLALQPDAAEHPDGPLGHWLASGADELPVPKGVPGVTWTRLRERLFVDQPPLRPAHTGVVVVLQAEWDAASTLRQIRAALAGDPWREVVVVGRGIDRSHRALITSMSCAWPSVHLADSPPDHPDGIVVEIHPDAVPLDGAVDLVIAALQERVVVAQAVGIDELGLIAAAGIVDGEPFLAGRLEADAEAEGTRPIDSVDGTLVARRASADHGDAVLVGNAIAITPAEHTFPRNDEARPARVTMDARPPDAQISTVTRDAAPPAAHKIGPTRRSRRWSLAIAAPADEVGRVWGDYYFAQSLQAALRAEGQHAGIQFREGRDRTSLALDDVVLSIHGPDHAQPYPGALNILWLISHPDSISPADVAAYDLVYAASPTWARRKTQEWGLPIEPMLQCTDPALFHPGLMNAGHVVGEEPAPDLLFLGNSRQEYRRAVRLAVEAGLDLTVIGSDWAQFLGPGVARAGVPNAMVGPLYANAGVVLNDHWDDMRDEGFISNRVFDAMACGARLLTDDVAGIREVFGDAVAVFTDAPSLVDVVRNPQHHFRSAAEREATAAHVIAEHSFSARARELVESAARLAAGQGRARPG